MSPEQKETGAMPNGNSTANAENLSQSSPQDAEAAGNHPEIIDAPGSEEAVLKKLAQKFQPEHPDMPTMQPLIDQPAQTEEAPKPKDKKTGFARFGRKAKAESAPETKEAPANAETAASAQEAAAESPHAAPEQATMRQEAPIPHEAATRQTIRQETANQATIPQQPAADDHGHPESAGTAGAGEVVEQPCGAFFKSLAAIGPLALLIILGLMVWPDFWQAIKGEALYCPPEVTGITAFLNSVAQQNLLEPYGMANGAFAPQWPLFTWFVGLLALIPMGSDLLWPLVGACGAGLALLATWYLGLGARFGARAAFAGGLILLCAPLFSPLGHFVGKSALAAAFVIFAIACFARGWLAERAYISLPLAFVSTGLAGLCGGVYCFALPLIASFCFLIWHGHPGRASKGDAIFGFGLLVALLGVWLGLVMLKGTNETYLASLFANSWHSPWPLPAGWWLAGFLAIVGLLPWILMIFGVSWLKVLAKAPKTLGASRRENGSALIWISAVLAWLLTFVFGTAHIAAIVTVCLLAALLGKAFLNLSSGGNRFFFLLCALGLILAGLLILGLSFDFSQGWILGLIPLTLPQGLAAQLAGMTGLWVVGGICLVGGLIMLRYARADHTTGGLIFATIIAIVLAQPATLMIAPDLGANAGNRLMTIGAIQQALAKALTPAQDAPVVEDIQKAPVDTQSAAPAENQPENTPPAENTAPADNQPAAESAAENQPVNAAPAENKPDNAAPAENQADTAAPAEKQADNAAPAENQAESAAQPESAPKAIPEKTETPDQGTAAKAEKTDAEPQAVPEKPVPEKADNAN